MAQATDYLSSKEGGTLLLDLRSVQELLLNSECEAQVSRPFYRPIHFMGVDTGVLKNKA